ncbi:hypothetical protein BRC88_01405 [Halobacteriales archaeon QS_4_69_225]|nr:MAG: hypothetical protein BRC88_01405 [Halobacteriales archaeon QS_4_69_225]
MNGECLGCGAEFDYDVGSCPARGWNPEEFREQGRHGLARSGHGEPDDDGGGGPPPGPKGATRI